MSKEIKEITVTLPGQDSVVLSFEVSSETSDLGINGQRPAIVKLQASGCHEFLNLIKDLKLQYGDVFSWPEPQGNTHSEILIRELVLKAKNQWSYPFGEEELCHCRKVALQTVDQAIIAGADTVKKVNVRTSAGTACGTCRPDIEKIIQFRYRK